MCFTEGLFDKNMAALKQTSPDAAEKVMCSSTAGLDFQPVQSKSGKPVVRAESFTLHSMYDPEKEARSFVYHCEKQHECSPPQQVCIFGFGFGYHIREALCKGYSLIVVEPRIEMIRFAMEHVDVSDVIGKITLITGSDCFPAKTGVGPVWPHPPSVKLNTDAYEAFVSARESKHNTIHRNGNEVLKSAIRIMVVSPVYGGSLPVAEYCTRALESLGHDVQLWDSSIFAEPFKKMLELRLDERNTKVLHDMFLHLISEMIVASCAQFEPDMVLGLAQAPLSAEAIKRLKDNSITTAFWFVEDCNVMPYWQKYAHLYDFYFTIQDETFIPELRKRGVKNCYYLPMAADPDIHRPLTLNSTQKQDWGSDISFMGAGYYNRQKLFYGLMDFDFKIWGTGWDLRSPLRKHVQKNGDRLSIEETVGVFNAARININLHSSVWHDGINPEGDFLNPRTFEICSCGGFQLVDNRSLLPRHFTPGSELVTYSSLDELRKKIDYYLNNPEERRRIAEKGRNRVLDEHTYRCRMAEMLEWIKARKPECFIPKYSTTPFIHDTDAFCRRHPEAAHIFTGQLDGCDRVDLDTIVASIRSKSGVLSDPEALFLLIKEYHSLFTEAGA